tara:strand:+ start:181 stop:639 length:459 start_codon:yes stop_codon:yes gene_type:complete
MCKASVDAINTRDAEKGDVTNLGHSPYGFPQFERPEDVVEDSTQTTVTCAITGQKMTISNIPPAAQEGLKIDDTITATFVEDAGDVPDKVFLKDGRLIDLSEICWAQTTPGEVRVTMLEMADAEERQRMLDTIAGRSTPKLRDETPAEMVTA